MYDIGKKVDTQIDQWNRIEFRNRPKQIWSSDFRKKNGAVVIEHRKDGFFNKLVLECWIFTSTEMNFSLNLTHDIHALGVT